MTALAIVIALLLVVVVIPALVVGISNRPKHERHGERIHQVKYRLEFEEGDPHNEIEELPDLEYEPEIMTVWRWCPLSGERVDCPKSTCDKCQKEVSMKSSYDVDAAYKLLKQYPRGIKKTSYCRKLSHLFGKIVYSTDHVLMVMEQCGLLAWESDDGKIGAFGEGEI